MIANVTLDSHLEGLDVGSRRASQEVIEDEVTKDMLSIKIKENLRVQAYELKKLSSDLLSRLTKELDALK